MVISVFWEVIHARTCRAPAVGGVIGVLISFVVWLLYRRARRSAEAH